MEEKFGLVFTNSALKLFMISAWNTNTQSSRQRGNLFY